MVQIGQLWLLNVHLLDAHLHGFLASHNSSPPAHLVDFVASHIGSCQSHNANQTACHDNDDGVHQRIIFRGIMQHFHPLVSSSLEHVDTASDAWEGIVGKVTHRSNGNGDGVVRGCAQDSTEIHDQRILIDCDGCTPNTEFSNELVGFSIALISSQGVDSNVALSPDFDLFIKEETHYRINGHRYSTVSRHKGTHLRWDAIW
mmetsp:Transcript_31670/g.50980  ORF Transcript_31670/g.50980 Transcript_31670/m.50980 type:complete len:202 (-) Transcript_31670:562-1167(-)